jgi:Flp pilus assembly protein TadD
MNHPARFLFCCMLALSAIVQADVVNLKDGRRLEGAVKKVADGWIVYTSPTPTHVSPDQLLSIELAPPADAQRLASLRRTVEYFSDLNQIINLYQRFIDQTTDPATLADAKKDLAVWKNRLDQKMVRQSGKWMLPEDRDKLAVAANELAEQARQLMKQNQGKAADPILTAALADDPANPSALYLLGLLRVQQQEFPAARKALDALAVLVPNHAPTLNNLGVVQWRQHQFVAALASFDAAMLTAPVNKDILDNVAVALAQLPGDFRNSRITQKTADDFQQQDQSLDKLMATFGWHRYATGWITDKDMAQFRQQQKLNQRALDDMAAQFDDVKQRLDQINQSIDDVEAQIDTIEASSYVRDPRTGVLFLIPYPPVYFQLQQDDLRIHKDRDQTTGQLDALQRTARALRDIQPPNLPPPVMKMIGPEGTPLAAALIPTTQPAAH